MRNQKGITLIALVITIIVLLILAGVSIAMLTGDNGILTQANRATVTNIEGRVDEEMKVALQAARLYIENQRSDDYSWDARVGDNLKTVIDEMKKDLPDDATEGGYTFNPDAPSGTTEVTSLTITYDGEDYKKATNKDTASIVYKLTVSQGEISITPAGTGETNPTLNK